MERVILTLNAGSSSIKYALFDSVGDLTRAAQSGQVEGIGTRDGPADHQAALAELMARIDDDARIVAVGHRIVHGGTRFAAPCLIDETVIAEIAALVPLAPLHQPHNLAAVHAAHRAFAGIPQVACFDTAFHHDMPEVHQRFAIPDELFRHGIRRYGFHGLSYESIVAQLHAQHPEIVRGRLVIAHLGNGCSMAALKEGRPITTTMSFSPLDGLTMGTRCGRIDAAVVLHLQQQVGWSVEEVSKLLHRGSGLLGLSGLSSDMRELEAAAATGHAGAQRAIDHFVEQALRELAGLAAALRGLDALVFTGGIGEYSALIRERITAQAGWLGIQPERAGQGLGAPVHVLVLRTDEQAVIAHHVQKIVSPRRAKSIE